MKIIGYSLLALICSLSMTSANATDTSVTQAIPVQIFKTTVDIRKGLTSADLRPTLASIIKDAPSVDTDQRLQYDVQLVFDAAPVTFVFDFDPKGQIQSVIIDSYQKSQNPAVTKLLAWLARHAGKPNEQSNGKIVWNNFNGWKIEHIAIESDEDSTYRIELTTHY
jgi:hypothetical protein